MHCQKCGKKLKPGETFCSICGYYNSEEDIEEESGNWEEISAGDEIEIEDDDSEKWFEEYEDDSDDSETSYSEFTIKDKPKKEGFWNKRKKAKIEKKMQREAKKMQQEQEKAEKKAKEEQNKKEKEEFDNKELVNRKEQQEIERQEREYQRALERQQKEALKYKKDEEYETKEDRYLEAYIGEDYEKITTKNFNIMAAILNWAYVIYRKLYITGIIGLIVTYFVIIKYQKFAIIYAIIVILLLGFGFNKYYILMSKLSINIQRKKFEGSDDYSMEKILSRKGGVNVIIALIVYTLFLAFLIYGIFHFTIYKDHNTKFFEENTNNEANCISLTKTSNNYLPNVEINGQIVESTCKVLTINNNKEFAIYLKLLHENKIIYAYFQTENSYLQYKGTTKNIAEYETKYTSGTLTDEEKQVYNELKSIQLTYEDVYEKSKEEVRLIKEKKNTKERTDFMFTKEEITR